MRNKLTNRQINNCYERLKEMKPRVQDEIRSKSDKITSKILVVLHIYCTRKWLKESNCARIIKGKVVQRLMHPTEKEKQLLMSLMFTIQRNDSKKVDVHKQLEGRQ
jgi:hypothetical protein